MQLLNLILLFIISPCNVVGELAETAGGCFNTSYAYRPLHLTCGSHHRIHVINSTYQKTTKDCQPSPVTCKVVQKSRSDAFSTTCNGLQTCLVPVQDFWIIEKCRDVHFFTVSISYECISDNAILNICNTTTATSSNGLIYLASPNFYNPVVLGPGRSCVCTVTGQDMVLELLELYLRLMKGARANLTLTTKNTAWSSTQHRPVVYNNIILRSVPVVDIDFNTLRRYGQMMWIRITGSSEINLSCNGGSNDTVYLPVEPSKPGDDGSTSTVVQGGNSTLTIVAITCGVIIVLLLVIIVLLIVYLKVQGSRRWRDKYNISRYDTTDISYIHYDHGSVVTEYDTVFGQQIPTDDKDQLDGEDKFSHFNDPDKPTSESKADRLHREDSYTSLSNLAYQRD